MKVVEIRATPFSIPMKVPRESAKGKMTEAAHVLVEVLADSGQIGYGEAPARPTVYGETQASIVAAIDGWWAQGLLPLDPFNVERVWESLASVQGNHCAKAALDLAYADLIGKAVGRPCSELMGGYAESVEVTGQLPFGPPNKVVEIAHSIGEEFGIQTFKIKIGADVKRDVETLEAMRLAFPGALLYADANQGYSLSDALRLAAAASACKLAWVEELCPTNARAARRAVANSGQIAIGGDESCRTLAEAFREIEDGCISQLTIKVARGGFVMSSRFLGLCLSSGTSVVIGTQGETGLGTLASLHFAVAHSATANRPAELSMFTEFEDDLLVDSPKIVGGRMQIPKSPGLGAEIDQEKLRSYSL